jgi:hypothetical protein
MPSSVSSVLIVTVYDADDTSVGEVVVVADDRLKEFRVFVEHFGDMVDGEDVGYGCHQAASAQMAATGDQFQGSSSSSLLILWSWMRSSTSAR